MRPMVRASMRSTSSAQVLVQSCGQTDGRISIPREGGAEADVPGVMARGYHPWSARLALADWDTLASTPDPPRRRDGMKSVEIDRTKRLAEQPTTGHNRFHP